MNRASTSFAEPRHRRDLRVRQVSATSPTVYRVLVLGTVVVGLIPLLTSHPSPDRARLLLGTIVALLVTTLARQRHLVNGLFRLVQRAPLEWRTGTRAKLAGVLHIGGIHSGAAVVAFLWSVRSAFDRSPGRPWAIGTALVLATLVLSGLPPLRHRWHDAFDAVHTLGVPLTVVLLWLQTLSLDRSILILALLAVLSGVVALPWLQVRRLPVSAVAPSSHVTVITLDGDRRPPPGTASSYSRSLLGQRHSFVNVPATGGRGWRLVVSRAGDWTGRLIDDPPRYLWRRGAPVLETGSMDRLFRSIVLLVTGSGIGPGLSHLGHAGSPTHLVWVTRDPEATFGAQLLDEIRSLSPTACIWDTTVAGRPNVEELALRELARSGAEAIFVISNRTVSQRVVETVRARGIPAFGPTWDT